ncbi:hypothetical protein H9P43_006969 [Blastocladiella emersonii ATCC 22665]|nr:hypothetical protein H9P43_006969 [Blastocladiella emersonii ATCC 22665]
MSSSSGSALPVPDADGWFHGPVTWGNTPATGGSSSGVDASKAVPAPAPTTSSDPATALPQPDADGWFHGPVTWGNTPATGGAPAGGPAAHAPQPLPSNEPVLPQPDADGWFHGTAISSGNVGVHHSVDDAFGAANSFDPSASTFDPSGATFDPSAATFDPSAASFDPSSATFDPTFGGNTDFSGTDFSGGVVPPHGDANSVDFSSFGNSGF